VTIVARGPGFIACSFTDCKGSGVIGKRTYYWDFSDRFGPLFTRADGRELDPQPGIRSNAWKAFEAWHKELRDDQHPSSEAEKR